MATRRVARPEMGKRMNANNDEEDTRTRTRELMTNRVFFEVVQLVQVSLSAYRLPDLLCYGRHFLLATFYGTPVSSVTAASVCVPQAKTPASGKTMCPEKIRQG